ncbi:hypothetical protein DPPLL_32040 [Desulfofustis limnaeus]|uniref:Transposase n=1 Tax=Desulfofustis limnaeus TaxID=2740163 RepID=A0ABM7WCW5_9BACT|nr:hypothetical protein DPPLL_32040 [Desulfofustis limnaeus]
MPGTGHVLKGAFIIATRVMKSKVQRGGLSEYAARVGKAKQNIAVYRDAAKVAINCNNDMTVLLDKAAHLAAIHSLPETCWQTTFWHYEVRGR